MKIQYRVRSLLWFIAIPVLIAAAPSIAGADIVDSVNALRARGCSGASGAPTKLKQTRALDAVAKEWSNGGRLQSALERTEYRAMNSSSMRVSGAPNDASIMTVLAQNYCRIVTDAAFKEIGIARRERDVWIVVATPLDLPSVKDAKEVAREVLRLVNEARAQPRKCGGTSYKATQPVQLSATLNRAALLHAQDMARNSHFEHHGTDGSTPAERATRVGYRWRHVAENIAAGAPTAAAVVEGWIKSPGHCANIMGAEYREMGIAYALNSKSKAGIYWAQTFATAR
jgi:uncharacterized protein YkwD